MADKDAANVFAIPDFWRGPRWLDLPAPENGEFFGLDVRSSKTARFERVENKGADLKSDEFFKLPSALECLAPVGLSKAQYDEPAPAVPQKRRWEDLDLFDAALTSDAEVPVSSADYQSWDSFITPDKPPVEPIFMTEAGPGAYDAALELIDDPLGIKSGGHNVVQTHPYIEALLALAMGRASIFFTWNERVNAFVQELDRLRISGYSTSVLQGLQTRCLECGNISRFLYVFVQITYKTYPSAGRVALAKAVDTVLLAVQTKLGSQARRVKSLLQLQSLIYPVITILTYFNALVPKLSKARNDEQLLSLLFAEAQTIHQGHDILGDIMREVLARVSQPWLSFTQTWIGLKLEGSNQLTKDNPGKSFVKVERIAYIDDFGSENEELDYVLDEQRLPAFIPEEIVRTIFETGKTLRLLRTHHVEHPLCNPSIVQSVDPPILDWCYDWNSIQAIQERSNEYETSMLKAMRQEPNSRIVNTLQLAMSLPSYDLQFFGQKPDQLAESLVASIREMDQPLPTAFQSDRLAQLLHDRLFEDKDTNIKPVGLDLSPHWSLLPLLSFAPLVEAQARLMNREYMKLLFKSHDLLHHMTLQKDFQLLGNGVFCDLLSHALFDANLETAERQAGVARKGGVMGLRLGSRETWPPASSELRLALMGVLTESYLIASKNFSRHAERPDLPGDLSFAVRDLSDEEIERCMNPESLEALDFLRLSYKPPPQLAPMFTPIILAKYDKIFKHILRILRMLYIVGELYRELNRKIPKWHECQGAAFRFRIEAQHFVTSITTYIFDTGIALPWSRFMTWLDKIRSDVENDDYADQRLPVATPDNVRQHHERMLDSITNTLLLRKRQQPVLKVLEDILSSILRFSKLARLESAGRSQKAGQEISIQDLYKTFKNKVDIFITVCRGLSDKTSQNAIPSRNSLINDERSAVLEENTIDRLLLQLEMSGYYGGHNYEYT